ncbi:MAG: dCMP deaminase family protein [Candidatus Electryonea clarkiae]|nr:dCMP deaminase family protein [Candidatus Electryonea clarkiae]MDP8285907.1 dCMP deaminase family protein [Candidatus Electryonea clarkiae]
MIAKETVISHKWQKRFIDLARFWAQFMTCDRAHVGAVIVRDKRVIASGYGGAPSGSHTCDQVGHAIFKGHCVRTVHAEMNAIAQAARFGPSVDGCDIYCTLMPCWNCAKMISAVGIARVYYEDVYHPEEWDFYKPLYENLKTLFIRLESPPETTGAAK